MPRLKLSVSHKLSQDEAARRVREWVEDLMSDHEGRVNDVSVRWFGHTAEFAFRAEGVSISGSLAVKPTAVRAELRIPIVAFPFKSQIKEFLVGSLSEELGAPGKD